MGSRHGPLPANVTLMSLAPSSWQPAPEDVSALGTAGRRFLERTLAAFDCTPLDGVLLLEAAHCLDGLTAWRPAAATDKQSARLALAHARYWRAPRRAPRAPPRACARVASGRAGSGAPRRRSGNGRTSASA